ncbi:MAG: alpha/beta hydrolase [Polyangiales bacterium]
MKGTLIDWFYALRHRLTARREVVYEPWHPFRTQQARDRYFASLVAREARWPSETETREVETSWARTFVRINGPSDAPPLLLLHGASTNSLSWEPNVTALSTKFRTYAVDNPWDLGKSVYHRDATRSDDFLSWLDELCDALGFDHPIDVAGMSYGAWITALFALRRPARVRRAVLIAPALTVLNVRLIWVLRALTSGLHPWLSKNFARWTLADALDQGDYERLLVSEVAGDGLVFARDLRPRRAVIPTKLSDEALASIEAPTLVLIGEHEKIYDPRAAVERVQRVAPKIAIEVVKSAGHEVALSQRARVNERVLRFLS